MLGVVIQIDAQDPGIGAPVALRAGSHDMAAVCHLTNDTWWPTIAKLPKLGYDLFDGAFESQIATPSASMSIGIEPWPTFGRLAIADGRFRLWTGEAGAPWATWTQRVDARVSQQPVVTDGRAELTFAVDDRWLDRALLSTYAGTTGAEGSAALKGQVKPLAFGTPRYVPGVLVDPATSLFQISAYGRIVAVDAALERLVRYGPPIADYPDVETLVASAIPAGRWATALSGGWVRFGAPPTGLVSFLVRGDAGGPDGWARRPGQLIRRLALLSGGAGRIADASLNALDAGRPYDLSLYLDQQTTARELIQSTAASVNAVAGVSWMGRLFVQPVAIGAPALTLAADGSALPPVAKVRQLEISPPFGKLAITAERTWTVHSLGDIAFTATLVDMGDYVAGTTYREGNIVQNQGSTWLYVNPAPSAGNAPPALPVTADAYWRVLAKAGTNGANGASAFRLRNVGNFEFPTPDSLDKVSGTNGWDGKARTEQFTTGSATVSATIGPDTFIGLTTDPDADLSYGSIDYGLHLSGDRGSFGVYRNNASPVWYSDGAGIPPLGLGERRATVANDGKVVRYSIEGVGEFYSHPVNQLGEPLYGVFAQAPTGRRISGVTFMAGGGIGVDGLPGDDGKDGQTWYPYFAYANSPDGAVDFTTGAPGSRAYVGTATGTSPTEPTLPGLYSWSEYKGPPFGIATRGQAVVAGRQIVKNGGVADWDSDAFSTVGFNSGAVASFQFTRGSVAMAGLNTDPTADASYGSLDFAFYGSNTDVLIYENGQGIVNLGPYYDGTLFRLHYDGQYVRYYSNDILVRGPIDVGRGRTYYFDSSLSTPGSRITNIDFASAGELGGKGDKGVDGINPPVVTVSASPQALKYSADGGTPLHGPITFTAVLTNAIGPVSWTSLIGHGLYNTAGVTFDGNTMTISAERMRDVIAYNEGNFGQSYETIIAAASGTSHRVAVTKVKDGEKGADSIVPGPAGVPALSLISSAPSLTFAADYLGNLKSGQLAQVIVLTFLEGATNVSTSVNWSVPEFSGCTGQMTSAGLVTFNSVTANGYFRVTGTYKGATLQVNVPIVVSRDAPPANSDQQASIGTNGFTISTNSYPAAPHISITVSVPGGTLRGKMDVAYSAQGQGNVYLEGMLGYRVAGSNNAWSFLPAVQGSMARINNNNPSEPINDQGYFTSNQTVAVAAGRYEVGIFLRRYQGLQNGITDGRFQASNG